MAIMNATYTYAAYYPTSIPRSPGGPWITIRDITIVDSSTHAVRTDQDIRLRASLPLLCPGQGDSVLRHVLQNEYGDFPAVQPTAVVYRPNEICYFDLVQPDAPGLQATVSLMYLAPGSTIAFTTSRDEPLSQMAASNKLLAQNSGDGKTLGLRLKGEQMSIWFAANGVAGHGFSLSYKRTRSSRGFSWSITVRTAALVRTG